MSVLSYKCPCCSSPLAYSGQSGKLECASCGNAFDTDALEALAQDDERHSSAAFDMPDAPWSDDGDGSLRSYTCQFCGAELVTDGTTSATECAYCGSPAVIPAQLEGGTKPAMVIPFKITQEQATEMFHSYFKGKRLLPNIFLDERNRVKEIRKLYVPYWLFDCEADACVTYDAERHMVTREGDWEVTRTQHFLLYREGALAFDGIPVDGSEKMDDRIAESIEPYDFSEAVSFQPAVLSGAMADRADVDAEICRDRAVERLEESTAQAFEDTARGYDSVRTRKASIHTDHGKATPVLLPVWVITTEKSEKDGKKTYTFAINGQTGRLTCDVNYSKAKSRKWFWGLTAGISLGGYALFLVLALTGVIA